MAAADFFRGTDIGEKGIASVREWLVLPGEQATRQSDARGRAAAGRAATVAPPAVARAQRYPGPPAPATMSGMKCRLRGARRFPAPRARGAPAVDPVRAGRRP